MNLALSPHLLHVPITTADSSDMICHSASGQVFDSSPLHPPQQIPPKYPNTRYNTSASTSPSASASSSPLTPSQLTDDSSVTDMSTGSSPATTTSSQSQAKPTISHSPSDLIGISPATPIDNDESLRFGNSDSVANPRKKPKNLKNLAVRTSTASSAVARPLPSSAAHSFNLAPPPRSNTSSAESSTNTSAVSQSSSAAALARRRPSNLSVITGGAGSAAESSPRDSQPVSQQSSLHALGRLNVLRHFQSSPALPLCETDSPSCRYPDSAAGLTNHHRPLLERSHSATSPIKEDDLNYDLPLSREEKAEAYPQGPICVFEPYLDLYLEPTAKQARAYQVIINVASEVRNPFSPVDQSATAATESAQQKLRLDGGGGIQLAPKRNRDSNSSFMTVVKVSEAPSPSEPTHPEESSQPEYIHVPWEHNSDIVPELLGLVRLIDDRIMKGMRVLVHCQCGVSRSATLVVAYCMYKRPQLTVQEAYDEIKRRSKWIGPNMNLIMQLQEFRSYLNGKTTSRRLTGGFRGLTPIDSSWNTHRRRELRVDSSRVIAERELKTAPLQPDSSPKDGLDKHLSSAGALTPGPSSAPSGVSWPITGESGSTTDDTLRTQSVPSKNDQDVLPSEDETVPGRKERAHSYRVESHSYSNGFGTASPVVHDTAGPDGLARRGAQNFSLPLRRFNEEKEIGPGKLSETGPMKTMITSSIADAI